MLASAGIDACDREYAPTERCVLQDLLVQLGAAGGVDAIARLVAIAEKHPQRELRLRALFGLLHAGPAWIDAAAGAPGAPYLETDWVACSVRARAALVRGDGPELAAAAPTQWKRAILEALSLGFRDRRSTAPQVASERLLEGEGPWLTFMLDAFFDPVLAERAEATLNCVPLTLWEPLVAKRKKALTAPSTAKKTPGAELAALDDELTSMRAELETIVRTLQREEFAFVGEPLRPPAKGFAAKLRKLEKRVGCVPLALARFWAIVGAIDLRGNHPAWAKKTFVTLAGDPHWYADPLVAKSLESALADAEGGDFDVALAPASLRYALDLAGDDVTKANFWGGIVSVETPSDVMDPPLRGRGGTFLEMLRESIAWRGFPGMA